MIKAKLHGSCCVLLQPLRGALPQKVSPIMMLNDREKRPEEESIKLTKREIEVLTQVLEGKSAKQVADMFDVSERTVEFHVANIYDKLQVHNRVQAFRRAARLGLIPYDPQFE